MKINNFESLLEHLGIDIEPDSIESEYKNIKRAIKKGKLSLDDTQDETMILELRNEVRYFTPDNQPGKIVKFPRPKAKIMRALNKKASEYDGMIESISTHIGITNDSTENMDLKDFSTLSEMLTLFL